jgi:hypothetical protein
MNIKRKSGGFFSAVCLFALLCVAPFLTGCGSTSTPTASTTTSTSGTTTTPTSASVLADLENVGWTVANAYEAANTGGVLTQAIASGILTATKSDPTTTAGVLLATSLADKVAAAGVAAHAAGATPQGVTNAQTALLADSGVITTTAQAAAAQASFIQTRDAALIAKVPLGITAEDVAAVNANSPTPQYAVYAACL